MGLQADFQRDFTNENKSTIFFEGVTSRKKKPIFTCNTPACEGFSKQDEVAFPELPQSCSFILQHPQLPELLGKQTSLTS